MPKSDDCVKAYFTHISPNKHISPKSQSAEDGDLSLNEANATGEALPATLVDTLRGAALFHLKLQRDFSIG
jgi:hypothetical protein